MRARARLGAWVAAAGLALVSVLPASAVASEVLGKKPSHVWGGPSGVPNEAAITRRIWAPGIDDGYVPQGVASVGGALFVSGYRSTDPKVNQGPCRLFKVDAQSGAVLGHFDLPDDCGHAGGLVHIGRGILVASDSRRLYRIDSVAAFAPATASKALDATLTLRGELKGSFVHFDGTALLVGSYEKDPARARGHFLPLSLFETHNGHSVGARAALRSIALPPESQGAAFDAAGKLWVAASSSRFGRLYRLDGQSGQIEREHEMVIGIEGLAFDADGGLWSVSEAGSLRWRQWSKTFPVLFRVDVGKLSGGT